MDIGGGKYLYYFLWFSWKNIQALARTHLSHGFALLLGVLVAFREWPELKAIWVNGRIASWFDVLIIVLTLATIGAAIWEFFGNKLTTSPQEIRFVRSIRLLLYELEKFAHGKDVESNTQERLDHFIQLFLDVTSETLCGKKEVASGLMLEIPNTNDLELIQSSTRAVYPGHLRIPIRPLEDTSSTGPAGVAFDQLRIVYMPFKKWKLGWPFRLFQNGRARYEPSEPHEGWIEAESKDKENFTSVLCLPVAIYERRGTKQAFGVLNYSTRKLDPFVSRDFIMGECFSSILAQAFAIAKAEADAIAKAEAEPLKRVT